MEDDPNPKTLESLVSTMHHLSTNVIIDMDSPSIKSFLDLEHHNSSPLIAADPVLSTLVAHIRSLIETLKGLQDYSFVSFVRRWLLNFEIAAVAGEILGNLKGSLDREMMEGVVSVLREAGNDEGKMRLLGWFYKRVCKGFDMGLQDVVLRLRVFELLESVVCDGGCVLGVREKAAMAIAALAGFNKDVFVGLVLMGHTVKGLVSMGTSCSLSVLASLIRLIRGHLVDEIDLSGDMPKIIGYLGSEDVTVRAMALDCLLEVGFFGRHETVEIMIECGLIEKLVFLQRQETCEKGEGLEVNEDVDEEEDVLEDHPFVGCVARFALQVEMGEGVESDEKSRIKMEILRRAREASVSEAEAATMVAELLWGSFS